MNPADGSGSATSFPLARPSWRQRFRHSTAGTWLAALFVIALPFVAVNIATKLLMPEAEWRDLRNLVKALVLIAAYGAYVHWWECRLVSEFSLAKALPESAAGLLLGGMLFAGVVAFLSIVGVYSVVAVGSPSDLGAAVTSMLPKILAGALIEELLFRLILLRLLQRSFGTAWALVISSLLFGLAHVGNAGASPLIGIMLGVELGLLLGAAWLLTRRIWLCAATHFAWNFVQGVVFSIAVSGQSGDGWLRARLTGPDWLTGGAFGAEASVVSFVLCLSATGVLLMLAKRRTAPVVANPA